MTNAIEKPDFVMPTLEQIEEVEGKMLKLPQGEWVETHLFAPGIYWREMFAVRGSFIIGHQHKTEHFSVLLSGSMILLKDGKAVEIKAPQIFVTEANTRKIFYITEDARLSNILCIKGLEDLGTDIEKLEDELWIKSETYKLHMKENELLKEKS